MRRLTIASLAAASICTGILLAEDHPDRVDRFGDPLPPGVVARLGTVRLRHCGMIMATALTPDGSLLVSAGEDGTVRFWDTATGKEVRRLASAVNALTVSPDGKSLLTIGAGRELRVWDVATGRERMPIRGLSGTPRSLAVSADGTTLAVATFFPDGVEIREVATGRLRRRLATRCTSLALSADGKTLALAGAEEIEGRLRLIDTTSGAGRKLADSRTGFEFLAFTPDGKHVIAQQDNFHLAMHDAGSGAVVHPFHSPPQASIISVALSADGTTLAAAYGAHLAEPPSASERTVIVWDVASGSEKRRLDVRGRGLTQIALSHNGAVLALGGYDGVLRGFDLPAGRSRAALDVHNSAVVDVAFAPDGRSLATAGEDGTVRLWNIPSGEQRLVLRGHTNSVSSVAFAADGRSLASTSDREGSLRTWDPATGRERVTLRAARGVQPQQVAFAPDGRSLIAAVMGAGPHLFNTADGTERPLGTRIDPPVTSVVIAGDGNSLAMAGRFGVAGERPIRIVSTADGSDRRLLEDHVGVFSGGAFSADGRLFACVGATRVWELASGCVLCRPADSDAPSGRVAFSPVGRLVACGRPDGSVALHDARTGELLRRVAAPDPGRFVPALAFSPDGRLLAASCHSTVLLWDVAALQHSPARSELPRERLGALWADLASTDAVVAHKAVSELLADPAVAAALLRERLAGVAFPSAEKIEQLVGELGDRSFKIREAATRELIRLGRWAEPAVRKSQPTDAEAVRRRDKVLKAIGDPSLATEVLRVHRAIWALELMATGESRDVLRWLTRHTDRSGSAQEAAAALRRLDAVGP